MKSPQFSAPSAELDARVTRFGLRIAAGLTERNNALPHDVAERLRFAREQALLRAGQARAAAGVTNSTANVARSSTVEAGSTLALRGGPRGGAGGNGLWAKLGAALPLILLLAGLLLMQRGQVNEQIAAAAEVDTALLSDQLPPAAFSDPGFAEFLRDGEE